MNIRVDTLQVYGTKIQGDNPLPVFRDAEKDKPSRGNGTLSKDEEKLLGANTGYRVLPYRMIDKYDRNKKPIALKSIVMENDKLQATFLPEHGGRLWSLKNLQTGKEILYTNPVFQPANLGIRNAWFSGGVEWNCAQYGHVVYSSSPVFFAKVKSDDGEEFLRMYEYERMKRLFVQIDFHLPDGETVLYAKVTIHNTEEQQHSMYWWTNIAIQATEKLRVFSGTDEVIYLDPDTISDNKNPVRVFGRTKLPYLPTLPGKDSSYPANATYSNEFFFQNEPDAKACWSAAVYEDGRLFFERSTMPLRFRKMFTWGTHEGGQRWCEYLATREDGNYVELQAGLAPTQLNSIYIPAKTKWTFTQAIGQAYLQDMQKAHDSQYTEARNYVGREVGNALPSDRVIDRDKDFERKSSLPVAEILSSGLGWGALEAYRGMEIPEGLVFPKETLDQEQKPWMALLEQGYLEEENITEAPASWMTDPSYLKLLQDSACTPEGNHYLTHLHLGVMLYELGRRKEGIEEWKKSAELQASPFALRNLAYDANLNGDMDEAVALMEKAVAIEGFSIDKGFSEELMNLYLQAGRFTDAWTFYQRLPEELKAQDLLTMQASVAAIELTPPEFAFVEDLFKRDISCIREGDTTLTDLYERYQVQKLLTDPANRRTPEEARQWVAENCRPPRFIDFRMIEK